MKYLYLVLSTLFVISCSSVGGRHPNSEPKPKHIVITLHGVRGNAESYGDFHSIVRPTLEKIDPSYEVETHNWTYPVGKMVEEPGGKVTEWTPHEIANKLNQEFFLGGNGVAPKIPSLGPQDKISFVAYSMGGLMIMSWYYDTMFNFANQPKLRYSEVDHQKLLGILERVENVIGLGAVYWGSLDAELGWSVLDKGNLSEIRKAVPKIEKLCLTPVAQKIISDTSYTSQLVSSLPFIGKDATAQEKRDRVVRDSIVATCEAVDLLKNKASLVTKNLTSVNGMILGKVKDIMTSLGNVSPREMNNMRLTSTSINDMRIGRIKHMINPELRNRFKTRWTSIVGVFPCLGKRDKGLTCHDLPEDFKAMNDGLVTLFSGLNRRETDGPVISPSAVADFMYYSEAAGNESRSISFEQFHNTMDDSKTASVANQEIFVENMHATVAPALEALPGLLHKAGLSLSGQMRGFDASLGTDVVIVNKECADPDACKHPNYKHILQALSRCEVGPTANTYCNQDLMNKFYHVTEAGKRLDDNNALRDELGSFVLTLNIRLPKNFQMTAEQKENLMQYFKFQFVDHGAGVWNENRLDLNMNPYELQIARPSEVISSYADLASYADSKVLRVFFVGRMKAKPEQQAVGEAAIREGVPVRFEVALPGVKSRRVVAKVKSTYSTYVDMFMK